MFDFVVWYLAIGISIVMFFAAFPIPGKPFAESKAKAIAVYFLIAVAYPLLFSLSLWDELRK